jgi:hypothetical protein
MAAMARAVMAMGAIAMAAIAMGAMAMGAIRSTCAQRPGNVTQAPLVTLVTSVTADRAVSAGGRNLDGRRRDPYHAGEVLDV